MANEIVFDIRAQIDDSIDKSVKSIEGKFLKLGAAITGALAGAFTFKKMIEEANKAENAINDLNAAMKVSGTFSKAASQSFIDFANSLQKTTTASSDAIIQGGALLVNLGKLSGEGLENATKAALDLSAALNIDTSTAFNLMAKASTGSVEALGKYGIKIDENTPKSQRFAEALEKIQASFGGLAEAKTDTFQGSVSKLSNSFNDLLKELGLLITQSPLIRGLISEVSKLFEHLGSVVGNFGRTKGAVDDIIMSLLKLSTIIVQYVAPPLELFVRGTYTLFLTLRGAIQELIIIPLTAAARAIAAVGSRLGMISKQTLDTLTAVNESAQEVMAQFNEQEISAFGKLFDFDATATLDQLNNKFLLIAERARQGGQTVGANLRVGVEEGTQGISLKNVVDEMKLTENQIAVSAASIAKHINQSLVTGISNAFVQFGKALSTGKNAFEEFGKAVLSAMGQMLIFFGQMLIVIGLGLSTVPFLFGLQGPAAVAAGIVATILGGVLMGMGGGGDTGGAAGAGGGGGGGGVGTSPTVTEAPELPEMKPQTSVTVNVQGNILDRRQTGLEIAEVINETFGTNGIVIANTA